ncbi:MAG: hypothetical protein STSR0009_12590 [Methanoregula sp.]
MREDGDPVSFFCSVITTSRPGYCSLRIAITPARQSASRARTTGSGTGALVMSIATGFGEELLEV